MNILPIRNRLFYSSILLVLILGSACGLLVPTAPQPALSATDIPPKATALSQLPDTWTPVPTPSPSLTPLPSPTFTPTQDPYNFRIDLVMEPVPISYPQQIPDHSGWETVNGSTASISIPPGYQVLDFAGTMMEMMFGVMEAFAEGMVDLAEGLGEELTAAPQETLEPVDLGEIPEFDFILAVEETTQSAIILVSADREPETTTEDLLNDALSEGETPFQVAERIIYTDTPYPVERVILDIEDEDLGPGKQVIYVILSDEQAWNLIFTFPANLIDEKLPLTEGVADSFQPAP